MNRPLRNGSSNSTVEILIALVVIGASALTALALVPRPSRDVDQEQDPKDDGPGDDA